MPACATCGAALMRGAGALGLCAACLLATALSTDAVGGETDADAPPTLQPGTMLGSFRIVRVLGRGGMATVYEALDSRLGRAVALKVLPPEFLHDARFAERFEQEARVVAALEHPHVVPIYATGIDDGIPWMSMRLLTGGTIAALLERGRLDAQQIVKLLRGVASGLDYAHAHGVVHRDIKPANILLDHADGVCVGDFGLAQLLEISPRVTRAGLLVGTPEYMAPEQALGKTSDRRCDLYSLAIVAYEMFVGTPPFTAGSPFAILLEHAHEELPVQPEVVVPRSVMHVIRKGAAKDPVARWPSATAFVDALDAALQGRGHGTPSRRLRWISAAGAVALAATTAGSLIVRKPPARAQPDLPRFAAPASAGAADAPARLSRSPAPPSEPAVQPPQRASRERRPLGTAPPSAAAPVEAIASPLPASTAADSLDTVPLPRAATAGGETSPKAAADSPIAERATTVSVPSLVSDVVIPATRTRTVSPEYPQIARAAQLEGDVLLEAVVSADGKVTDVAVLRSVHPLLDEAARQAVLQYEYTAARRNGVNESSAVRLTVSFRMR